MRVLVAAVGVVACLLAGCSVTRGRDALPVEVPPGTVSLTFAAERAGAPATSPPSPVTDVPSTGAPATSPPSPVTDVPSTGAPATSPPSPSTGAPSTAQPAPTTMRPSDLGTTVPVAPAAQAPLYDLDAPVTCRLGQSLRQGDSGQSVRCLQQRLDEITPSASVTIDGEFDSETDSQVRLFQALHNLTVDGIVGQQTAGMLNIWDPASAPTTAAPVQAVAVAAAPIGDCNPNYSGCVPNDSDVDCAGGSGNGPSYTGRVQVIGRDVYDLDRDGDGIACE